MVKKDKNIADFEFKSVYRSFGGADSMERIGAGLMDKSGRREDFVKAASHAYSIVYVIEGEGEYIERSGNSFPIGPGSFFQRFPDMPHSNYINPLKPWKECFIDFGKELFNAFSLARIIRPEYVVGSIGSDPELVESVKELVLRLEKAGEDDLPSIVCSAAELTVGIFRKYIAETAGKKESLIVEKACRMLGEELEKRMNIEEFCASQHWGYESFRKIFTKQMGISPGRYRVRRRIDAACQMLTDSDLNVNEIASELGYLSAYEFSSQFKKFTGVSPKNFRSKKVSRRIAKKAFS